ncbi:BZ3500_MvSof-1268-A1-R1_Chr6-3g08854 [Microbotryum saponariae]|uniref:BZ3500_MvSof-1268-A1-R1_Chr6-3g08854 protein n=1 Tax=Microbotryum saponariae TaxID=289078 RepID=A0A2X0KJT1_9BASI|nr:BZ3500_MvSof-1268-A1-R1_Chr6-3g08854 [Microbotryum saponariae]SDA07455.1 BZ3501_MvSof-1269-A2-R1_Chr6-2g08557 [Microbotryum saponariae]
MAAPGHVDAAIAALALAESASSSSAAAPSTEPRASAAPALDDPPAKPLLSRPHSPAAMQPATEVIEAASPSDARRARPASSTRTSGDAPTTPLAAPMPASTMVPSSPSASSSSTNRFGLALGFMGRRPRGFTNPPMPGLGSGTRFPVGGGGPGSPSSELPSSPGASERMGYGFPALRRSLSKRATVAQANQAGAGALASSSSEGARTRARRSSSQPQLPAAIEARDAVAQSHGRSRPRTAIETGVLTTSSSLPSTVQPISHAVGSTVASAPMATAVASTPVPDNAAPTYRLRLVPHLETSRSLHFEAVDRELAPFTVLRVGRFTDRANHINTTDQLRITFKSKVVSRGHAEVWCDATGKFFIKDTKSSSGTFLNHIRLSSPNMESRPYGIKDGDILQLGVDYQGGAEEIYRCVKMKVELNRGWQRGVNSFNTAALAQLRALGGSSALTDTSATAAKASSTSTPPNIAASSSVTDCCICLYPVTVCQALFIAPCSHVTHYKCIRPLVLQNYPGFSCPLCRTYADLEADVEIDPPEPDIAVPGLADPPPVVDEAPECDIADRSPPMNLPMPAHTELSAAQGGPSVTPDATTVPFGDVDMIPLESDSATSAPNAIITSRNKSTTDSDAVSVGTRPPASNNSEPLPIETAATSDNDAIYASLMNAATPPNSTFLSTLAERADSHFPRFHTPVASLDMALLTAPEAGPSATVLQQGSTGSDTDAANGDDEGLNVTARKRQGAEEIVQPVVEV